MGESHLSIPYLILHLFTRVKNRTHAPRTHASFSLNEINFNLPVQRSKHIFTFPQKRKNSLPLNPSK